MYLLTYSILMMKYPKSPLDGCILKHRNYINLESLTTHSNGPRRSNLQLIDPDLVQHIYL